MGLRTSDGTSRGRNALGRAAVVLAMVSLVISATAGAVLGAAEHDRTCPRAHGLQFLTTEQFNRIYYACGR
ncbi:hypothetical protein GCM10009838_78900 [Catenulispora subtropica]|uniref:Uncharacterized protein n=1 Tax=Catenulispora subtropica TaxID=450798 RepID=A0ABN2TAB0_9ACTN